MNFRRTRSLIFLGLGAVAGAVLPRLGRAQVPARRDTLKVALPARADSMIKNDSLIKSVVPLPRPTADTLQPPIARAEAPPVLEIGGARVYDRAAIFATGALTLSDMLARVPGLTEYTTGFLAAPALVASQGDFRRIRLFLDGLELDPMDRRSRGVAPINDMPLHALEEIRIERGADEVRVYARTWRVSNTDPYTRSDVSTGDQNTNFFRAYLGRRYDHGELLQFSADYANTQPDRGLPSSDAINAMLRVGTTRGPWSIDAFLERTGRSRAQWVGTGSVEDVRDTVPALATHRLTSYLRLGNGDPDVGRWFQVIASANDYHGERRTSNSASSGFGATATDTNVVSSDSVSYTSQYLITGGMSRGPFLVSAAQRVRVGGNRTSHVLSARASTTGRLVQLSLFAEGQSYLDPGRSEGTVRFTPVDRVVMLASASRTNAGTFDRLFSEPRTGAVFDVNGGFVIRGASTYTPADSLEATRYSLPARTNVRTEVGVRVRDLWLSAGTLRRGPTTLLPPAEFAGVYTSPQAVVTEGEANAKTLSARGRLWRGVQVDAWAQKWDDSIGYYRPQYQTRSELFVQTSLLNRFPGGNFGILGALSHEYRSSSRFPVAGDTVRMAPGYRALGFKLEIRIQSAVISYQFRNLLQERYAQVPGFNLPRQTQIYGVRWEFWN